MSDTFQWTDDLVDEYYNWLRNREHIYGEFTPMEKFKQSKQKSKDWEVVSYDAGMSNGYFSGSPTVIKSVRRLSDGEVFSVGDKIIVSDKVGIGQANSTIDKFFITHENNMAIDCSQGGYTISSIQKAKQPLFKTEDGKYVYEGDNAWTIRTGYDWEIHEWIDVSEYSYKVEWKYFSTEAAAKEYVVMNKPCLSLQEILDRVHAYLLNNEQICESSCQIADVLINELNKNK